MEMDHQAMGYDRAITMFSPDGRLLQVEYAKKTVKQGTTVMGMICSDGVVLIADKRIMDKLMVPEAVEKIFQVDDHIAATVSGLVSDGRVLIERAQIKAQQHRVTYDSPIDTLSIVKDICDLKQICTQSGGLRPFGVSLLVVGVDDHTPVLFLTEPSGIYFQYSATAIGEGSDAIVEILNKEYKRTMNMKQCVDLGLKALKNVLGSNFKLERVEISYIDTKERKFKRLMTKDEIKKFV
ncbi:archaeal proteasome endopeptidase complex subunit alpha [Candidatus Woesearchaeota archaeon]|nr:archaeal proteasome endopeptidase complex subunit alpha [Candidatus Woesearchaeota archaeon]MBW3014330.1 archaeal proteasome endopeptidase complex subunit alpha [Candidatus Woesearchaeota archaeon]